MRRACRSWISPRPLTSAQVVWGALIFLALYLLLSRWALPKATVVLEKRASTIAGDLDAARMAMAQADGAVAELTAATAKARAEAQAAVEPGRRPGQADGRRAGGDAECQAGSPAERGGDADRARRARRRWRRSHQVASETAATVFASADRHPPDPARLDTAIGAALAARSR